MENNKKFVIQKHTRPVGYSENSDTVSSANLSNDIHWDLMLETQDVLETYRLPMPPEKTSNQPVEAIKIFDHPLKFLTYEGPVNKGKGTVAIADSGTYQILQKNETQVVFQFDGKILKGRFTLTLIEENRWEFKVCRLKPRD